MNRSWAVAVLVSVAGHVGFYLGPWSVSRDVASPEPPVLRIELAPDHTRLQKSENHISDRLDVGNLPTQPVMQAGNDRIAGPYEDLLHHLADLGL